MLTLSYHTEHETITDPDFCGDYIKETQASIYYVSDDLVCEVNTEREIAQLPKTHIGSISWTYVYARDMEREGMSCSDMCSSFDEDLALLYFRLFDEDGIFNDSVCKAINDHILSVVDFALIRDFEIFPEFRGQGVGLMILDLICRRIVNGAAVIAIQPMPVQFCEVGQVEEYAKEMELEKFAKDQVEAKARLKKYYKKAGFVPLKRSEFLIRGQS